jgi:hypothetical protein
MISPLVALGFLRRGEPNEEQSICRETIIRTLLEAEAIVPVADICRKNNC